MGALNHIWLPKFKLIKIQTTKNLESNMMAYAHNPSTQQDGSH